MRCGREIVDNFAICATALQIHYNIINIIENAPYCINVFLKKTPMFYGTSMNKLNECRRRWCARTVKSSVDMMNPVNDVVLLFVAIWQFVCKISVHKQQKIPNVKTFRSIFSASSK